MSIPSDAQKFSHPAIGPFFIWDDPDPRVEASFLSTHIRLEGQPEDLPSELADRIIDDILQIRTSGSVVPDVDAAGPETVIEYQDGTGTARDISLAEFQAINMVRLRAWLQVGEVRLPSGRLIVADPCYRRKEPNLFLAPGAYWSLFMHQRLEAWGNRIAMVGLLSVEADPTRLSADRWGPLLGVDSGYMAVLDEAARAADPTLDPMALLEPDYPTVYERDGLVMAASGVGDGTYPLFLLRREDQVVGMAVEFLDFGLPLEQLGAEMADVLGAGAPPESD